MILLNKKKINRYLGDHTKTINDRAYTREEIKKIIDASDLKYKVIVSLMVILVLNMGYSKPKIICFKIYRRISVILGYFLRKQ
jgi:hypothetical protein